MEIIGIGACVVDTLIRVPYYPKEDTKLRATDSRIAGGGPTATGLIAAAKLGAECAYIGVLSNDSGGTFLKQDFEKYGVDTNLVSVQNGYRSFSSVILLSQEGATRTCVFDKGNLPALTLHEQQIASIQNAGVLMVDGNELEAAVEAAEIARKAGTKVLYDCGGLYPGVERLLSYTDIMIPSEEFAQKHTGCDHVEDAAKKLYELYMPEVVVITQGVKGGILYDGKKLTAYQAFVVDAVDTNGAGDVFHGAFAAAVVKGYNYETCCLLSSAVSALKCTGVGARESAPDLHAVKRFMEERGHEL